MRGPASHKDVHKVLPPPPCSQHMQIGTDCRIDKTQLWKQTVLDIRKLKEKWLSLLKSPNKVDYGDKRIDADKLWEEIVKLNSEFVAACPSTKQEIH